MNGSNGFPPSVALAASSSTPVDVRRGPPMPESLARLAKANEETWMAIGAFNFLMSKSKTWDLRPLLGLKSRHLTIPAN